MLRSRIFQNYEKVKIFTLLHFLKRAQYQHAENVQKSENGKSHVIQAHQNVTPVVMVGGANGRIRRRWFATADVTVGLQPISRRQIHVTMTSYLRVLSGRVANFGRILANQAGAQA